MGEICDPELFLVPVRVLDQLKAILGAFRTA